jgi:SAM-dependent methyltransferase
VSSLLGMLKPLLLLISRIETAITRAWVSAAYRRQMLVQWYLPPEPESFEHHIDLYYQWLATRDAMWVERGVFSLLALRGGDALEIACGDGFNARNFYSARSRRVVACDIDPAVIAFAKARNAAPNVEYLVQDVRNALPEGPFENVVWDAAIEHFTEAEIFDILVRLKARLVSGGLLSGYTIVEREDGQKHLTHHEHEFKSKEQLGQLLSRAFRNVLVFETVSPTRHNLYFYASEGSLPFSAGWPKAFRAGPQAA